MLPYYKSAAAICSHCKSKQSKLELWQDGAKRSGLSEKLFLKCTLCFNEVEFQTSKRIKNKVYRKIIQDPSRLMYVLFNVVFQVEMDLTV